MDEDRVPRLRLKGRSVNIGRRGADDCRRLHGAHAWCCMNGRQLLSPCLSRSRGARMSARLVGCNAALSCLELCFLSGYRFLACRASVGLTYRCGLLRLFVYCLACDHCCFSSRTAVVPATAAVGGGPCRQTATPMQRCHGVELLVTPEGFRLYASSHDYRRRVAVSRGWRQSMQRGVV